MSVLRPRNRLIYFRVSEDEYQRYNDICQSTGSRSISDLVRSAMESMVQSVTPREECRTERLAMLEALVTDLNHKVHELSRSLGSPGTRPATSEPEEISARVEENL